LEFNEKLQSLRKSRGMTQEELAESLYVSRTAVSKWESGRGYPSIDSIRDIAAFFSVTIDDLLSSEKILSLAEKENRHNIQRICNLLWGMVDLFTLMLIVLPLYPHPVGEHIASVSLPAFSGLSAFSIAVYWVMYLALMAAGALKVIFTQLNIRRGEKAVSYCSMGLSVLTVLFLILTRQAYGAAIMFVLLMVKGMLYLKYIRA